MRKYLLIGATAFVLGAGSMAYVSQQAYASAQPKAKTYKMLELFGDVLDTVERQYVTEVDDKKLIEAAIDGMLIGCLYLPNGNPAPGPKFDYKLRWFQRLHAYAGELIDLDVPALLVGDFNVMPTDLDVYAPERWRDDALFRPEVRKAYAELVSQGWTDAIRHLHPYERIYTFWKYWRHAFERDAGLRIDHFLLSPAVAPWLRSASVRRRPRGWDHTSDHAPVVIEIEPPSE